MKLKTLVVIARALEQVHVDLNLGPQKKISAGFIKKPRTGDPGASG